MGEHLTSRKDFLNLYLYAFQKLFTLHGLNDLYSIDDLHQMHAYMFYKVLTVLPFDA